MTDDPIVRILTEAAARGRELRAWRQREPMLTAEDQADDESRFAAAMRQANQQEANDLSWPERGQKDTADPDVVAGSGSAASDARPSGPSIRRLSHHG